LISSAFNYYSETKTGFAKSNAALELNHPDGVSVTYWRYRLHIRE